MSRIDELVSVGAVFVGGVVTPKWIGRKGEKIAVKSVPLIYEGKEGDAPLLYYSLLSETAMYGVVWNRKTNVWRLIEVEISENSENSESWRFREPDILEEF